MENENIELNEQQQTAMDNYEKLEAAKNNENGLENIDNVEVTNELETNDNNTEDLLAGKYKTQEELIKGYLELQKKLSSGENKQENNEIIEEKENNEEIIEEEEKEENTDKIDFEKYTKELQTNEGKLSDDSYNELEKLGFTKEIVDEYVRGQQLIQEKSINEYNNTITTDIGGEENYNKMIEWASENLNESESNTFNKILDSGDLDVTKFAINNLYNRFSNETKVIETKEPKLINGNTNNVNSQDKGFKSKQEYALAMTDKRYNRDAVYTKQVREKMAQTDNSIVFG